MNIRWIKRKKSHKKLKIKDNMQLRECKNKKVKISLASKDISIKMLLLKRKINNEYN